MARSASWKRDRWRAVRLAAERSPTLIPLARARALLEFVRPCIVVATKAQAHQDALPGVLLAQPRSCFLNRNMLLGTAPRRVVPRAMICDTTRQTTTEHATMRGALFENDNTSQWRMKRDRRRLQMHAWLPPRARYHHEAIVIQYVVLQINGSLNDLVAFKTPVRPQAPPLPDGVLIVETVFVPVYKPVYADVIVRDKTKCFTWEHNLREDSEQRRVRVHASHESKVRSRKKIDQRSAAEYKAWRPEQRELLEDICTHVLHLCARKHITNNRKSV